MPGVRERLAVGPGFASKDACPNCHHTRCGEGCNCDCDIYFAEEEAETATNSAWRSMIERALGLEPDPINHTLAWCEETLLRVRELGNRGRADLANAWCRGVDDAVDGIPGGDEYASAINAHVNALVNPWWEGNEP